MRAPSASQIVSPVPTPFKLTEENGARNVENATRRDTPRVILCGGQDDSALRDLLCQFGYRVIQYLKDAISIQSFGAVDAVVIPASAQALGPAFSIVHAINTWRFTQNTSPLGPEVIVIAAPSLTIETIADFREQFCRVIHHAATQLFGELRVIAVERARLLSKGVLLLFHDMPGSLLRVFLVGCDGRQSEMDLNLREIRLLRALVKAHRAMSRFDLAAAVGCKPDLVKVYVERLKAEYELRRVEAGILMRKDTFISNPGHGVGYRVHARVKMI